MSFSAQTPSKLYSPERDSEKWNAIHSRTFLKRREGTSCEGYRLPVKLLSQNKPEARRSQAPTPLHPKRPFPKLEMRKPELENRIPKTLNPKREATARLLDHHLGFRQKSDIHISHNVFISQVRKVKSRTKLSTQP